MSKTILNEKPLAFIIDDLIDSEFCQNMIKKTEALSYEAAPITLDGAKGIFQMNTDIRSNDRVICDDKLLAALLFKELREYLPEQFKSWSLERLNERFRFYRYTPGQTFKPHLDGKYKETEMCESKLTLLIYLSDVEEGGETTFFGETEEDLRFSVKPKIGRVVIFDHHQLHSGDPVVQGVKYVLRTDVMYKR